MPDTQPAAPHPDRRPFVAIAVVAAIAFAALGLAVAGGPLPIDVSVAAWLTPLHAGLTGAIIDVVNLLGEAPVWDTGVALVAVVLWFRGWRLEAVVLVLGVLGAEAGASVAKLIVNRERPAGVTVTDLITQASYPSGHMTRAVVTSGLLAWFVSGRPGWRVPAALVAIAVSVLMGVSRIASGEHFFTDVVGAALFGIASLALIWLAVDVLRPRLVAAGLTSGARSG